MEGLVRLYKKSSVWAKLVLFFALLLVFTSLTKPRDSMTNQQSVTFKEGTDVYDTFYSDIYDQLVFSNVKDAYEIDEIVKQTHLTEHSIVLDVGCGTGHHVAALTNKGYNCTGVDKSVAMVANATKRYPDDVFEVGDAMNLKTFGRNEFTHILCLYFTLYYFENKRHFFDNCQSWLKPGGMLVVHIVDRDMFDPILPPANPLLILSPQRYAKQRITKSQVTFDNFKYAADFQLDSQNNKATFHEKFSSLDTDAVFRKQKHSMYMEDEKVIVKEALNAGFIMVYKVDLIKSGYEYQYLYVFQKP